MHSISKKRLTKNLLISVMVQAASLAISFLLNLAVPKFIDEYQYTYWQTYLLYVGYVGVLHFGLLDGLVLRYSKYDYHELDKPRIRSQFLWLLSFTGIIAIGVSTFSLSRIGGTGKWIMVLVAVGIVTKNLVTYSLYSFQITNRVSKYALLIMLQKFIYGFGVAILLLLRVNDFVWYCLADLAGDLLGTLIISFFNRGMYFGKVISFTESATELRQNVTAGIFLMLANWSAMLLLGGAKMFAQWHFDDLLFGKISFAFSVLNLFLTFVTTISVVLFPALKRLDEDTLPTLYKQIRDVVTLVLLFAIALYFPGCWVLGKWLPAYAPSLVYLGLVLPLVIYSSKVSLLTNNFLKVYRKERLLLLINLGSVLLGGACFAVSTFVLDSVECLLLSMVAVIIVNSVVSELVVTKHIRIRFVKDFIFEGIVTVLFILIAYYVRKLWLGFLLYLGVIAVYCALNPKAVTGLMRSVFSRKRRGEAQHESSQNEQQREAGESPRHDEQTL